MPVPFLDLRAQYRQVQAEVETAVSEVLHAQRFVLGPVVERFEHDLAAYCGVAHGIGVSSGTDALLAALMAEGIGAGDEVITTPFTFFATAGVIHRVGATPVFVDIDPTTYNLDPERVEAAVTRRTRAVIAVHLFGQLADLPSLLEVADQHGLVVIEDACQSLGARADGRRAGSFGHYGCFSFFPSKNLGGAGDGGMVVCGDPDRADRVRRIRSQGATSKHHHELVGGNFRLDALQAAILLVKLRYLDEWTEHRRANADRYRDLFRARCNVAARPAEPPEPETLVLPFEAPRQRHVYNQFVIRVPSRDAVRAHLTRRGVGHEVYYPVPLHLQPCFANLALVEGTFPESERAAREVLALPIYPELSTAQQLEVVEAVVEAISGGRNPEP
jgi:dTDP-4-amino-4,6-dideoxygalactose transaminase